MALCSNQTQFQQRGLHRTSGQAKLALLAPCPRSHSGAVAWTQARWVLFIRSGTLESCPRPQGHTRASASAGSAGPPAQRQPCRSSNSSVCGYHRRPAARQRGSRPHTGGAWPQGHGMQGMTRACLLACCQQAVTCMNVPAHLCMGSCSLHSDQLHVAEECGAHVELSCCRHVGN